jgi:CheY-like chemotaxis protein
MNIQKNKCLIIIIEDDFEIRESIREALEFENYKVIGFKNGKDAIEGLKNHAEPCLILLDLMMPIMDGWQFMEARKHLPDTYAAIPIFIVSAVADQTKVKEAGATGYIRKPVDLDVLLHIAQRYCEHG